MKKIITLTVNPALDVYTTVERLEPEKKLNASPATRDAGGGGINVSRVLKRLGVEAGAIYTCGGHTGNNFTQLLNEEEIEQHPVSVKNDMRQNFSVSETSTGKLFRFGFPGAELYEGEYQAILEILENIIDVDFLVVSGSLPPKAPSDFYRKVAKIAKTKNLKLVVDTSGDALCEILKEGAYLIKPNKEELEALTGKKTSGEEEQKELLREVLEKYNVEIIVVSLGPDGALLATKGEVTHFPAPKVEFTSSIGAGDSMVAGMVCSLSRGKPLEEAVMFGLACGSATIKSPGTQLLTREDALELFEVLKNEVRL